MLISTLLAIPMAALMAINSAGMDMDYEGEIDIYSDLPITESQNSDSQQTVVLSEGVSYDRKTHMFSYLTPDKSGYVQTSIADGMITTEQVAITLPEGLPAAVFCNGEKKEDINYSAISAPGGYALVITGQDAQYQLFSFQIVPEKTGAITSYRMPTGFKLTKLVKDGSAQRVTAMDTVDMEDECKYEITYRCSATGIDYHLDVDIDHTPPFIVLEGLNAERESRGPVTVTGLSSTDRARLTLNEGEVAIPSDGILKTPGVYHLSVTDDAGNVFAEDFEILFYLNMQGLIFTLLAVGVAAGIFLYMYISKKRLKVR